MFRVVGSFRRVPGLLGFRVTQRKAISSSGVSHHERIHEVLPPLESFSRRHIGPSEEEIADMLRTCGVEVRFSWDCKILKDEEEYACHAPT